MQNQLLQAMDSLTSFYDYLASDLNQIGRAWVEVRRNVVAPAAMRMASYCSLPGNVSDAACWENADGPGKPVY